MNELTTLQNNKFELCPFTKELKDTIAEEMEGLGGTFHFQAIKVPSGGSLAFEVPGEDEDNPDVVKELKGVIVFHHNANSRWEKAFDGTEQSPLCSSNDGKTAMDFNGDYKDCDSCPYNQYGSGADGVGKACKNTLRVYMMLSGSAFPMALILPPTSIKSYRGYIQTLMAKGKKSSSILTSVTLKKETSKAGIVYSCCVFKNLGDLSAEEKTLMTEAKEALKNFVTLTPSKPSEASDVVEAPKDDDSQYVPF